MMQHWQVVLEVANENSLGILVLTERLKYWSIDGCLG